MSRHRNDIGGFQPTNTLHAPGLHTASRLPNQRHSSPLQPRKKHHSPDRLNHEQLPRKRQRREQHHDVQSTDGPPKPGLSHEQRHNALPSRETSNSREPRASTSPPQTTPVRRGSENAFAPLRAPSGKLARKALPSTLFQNSEYRLVEERMKSSPHGSRKTSWKHKLQPMAQSTTSEHTISDDSKKFQKATDPIQETGEGRVQNASSHVDHTAIDNPGNEYQISIRNLSPKVNRSKAFRDSSDELAEDHNSPSISKAQGMLTTVAPADAFDKNIPAPHEAKLEFQRLSLMQFQSATNRRGPGSNVSLQIPKNDKDPRARVISSNEEPLIISLDDFDSAMYTQQHCAALIFKSLKMDQNHTWSYLRFQNLEHLSAFLEVPRLTQMNQRDVKAEELQQRFLDLRQASAKASVDDVERAIPVVTADRITSRVRRDRIAKNVSPAQETRVKRINTPEPDLGTGHGNRTRSAPSPTTRSSISISSRSRRDEPERVVLQPSRFAEICRKRTPWKEALIYPRTGRHRATVEWVDLERLDDEEFLNDNIISFCLLHIQNTGPGLLFGDSIYFFNTFFYSNLTKPLKGQRGINYAAVKSWTKNVDLFSYDYIVVPIHRDLHWYCAIICNVRQLQAGGDLTETSRVTSSLKSLEPSSPIEYSRPHGRPSGSETHHEPVVIDVDSTNLNEKTSQLSIHDSVPATQPRMNDIVCADSPVQNKKGAKTPRSSHNTQEPLIIILDSLGNTHPEVSRHLKDYLKAESLDKRNIIIDKEPKGLNAKGQPGQHNFSDCGVFLVAYLTRFVQDPARFVEAVIQRDSEFWASMEAHRLRKIYLELILQTYDATHASTGSQKQTKRSKAPSAEKSLKNGLESPAQELGVNGQGQQRRRSSGYADKQPQTIPQDGFGRQRADEDHNARLSPDVQVPASDEAKDL